MHILQDFIPDFTLKITTGTICNRSSSIFCDGNICFISLFNKLNRWNIKTQELLESFGSRKQTISAFLVQGSFIVIGYEDGSLEIIRDFHSKEAGYGYEDGSLDKTGSNDPSLDKTGSNDPSLENLKSKIIKPHQKRITKINLIDDLIISASFDGTISHFDLILEEIKFFYEGNSSPVENIFVTPEKTLFAACSDRSVKIWEISMASLKDVFVFDEDIRDVLVYGNEFLVFLKSGNSFLINFQEKIRKPFEKFKNVRNVKMKGEIVAVQCQKKISVFKITKKTSFGLVALKRQDSLPEFTSFDIVSNQKITPGKMSLTSHQEIKEMMSLNSVDDFSNPQICFLSKDNKIVCGEKSLDFGFHKNDILDIKTDHSKIFSLSKDRLICWNKSIENILKDNGIPDENDQFTKESLDLFFSIQLFNASCFDFFSNFIVIGNHEGLILIDRKLNEIKNKIFIGNVISVSVNETHMAVSVGNRVIFYDNSFNEINSLNTPEDVVYSLLLEKSFFCSCLDNKIYHFLFPSLELKITLYGHSLPVRNFSISSDEKLLVSCGADKLVKLWGLDFGECRKSFIGNCRNVKFLNESLFIFCDGTLQYYNYFEKLKNIKIFNAGVVCPGTDYIIVSSDRGLSLLTMNKYEYVKEEESNEIESLVIKSIENVRDYDTFLDHLQGLEDGLTTTNTSLFYDFIEKIDFNELKQYLYVLDFSSISLILEVILMSKEKNIIVLSRLFTRLFQCHKEACLTIKAFEEIRKFLQEKVADLRGEMNFNKARLEMEFYGVDLE